MTAECGPLIALHSYHLISRSIVLYFIDLITVNVILCCTTDRPLDCRNTVELVISAPLNFRGILSDFGTFHEVQNS